MNILLLEKQHVLLCIDSYSYGTLDYELGLETTEAAAPDRYCDVCLVPLSLSRAERSMPGHALASTTTYTPDTGSLNSLFNLQVAQCLTFG